MNEDYVTRTNVLEMRNKQIRDRIRVLQSRIETMHGHIAFLDSKLSGVSDEVDRLRERTRALDLSCGKEQAAIERLLNEIKVINNEVPRPSSDTLC